MIFAPLINAQQKYTSKSAKAIKNFEEGRSQYRIYAYSEAELSLLKAIKNDSEFIEAYIVLGTLYWDIDSLEKAISTFNKGLSINPTFYSKGFLVKANIEMESGKYEDAISSINQLFKYEKSDKIIRQGEKLKKRAEFAAQAIKNPVDFVPVLLDSAINTPDDEYWPSLSADEQTLIFTRQVGSSVSRHRSQEDFYISDFKNGKWSFARNAGQPLNTPDNEGAQTISADGSTMVYTVCNRRGVYGRCDLYYSERKGGQWSEPVNLGRPVNSGAMETQPSLSADGRTLYFISNREGGKGGYDVWVTYKLGEQLWSKPLNLGDSINTPDSESSPFIHHDNNTLYFSSDGHLGMGGYDIFVARKNSQGGWGKSVNIGYPINTHRDEIGMIVTAKGDRAYYASGINPERGKDIYQFELYPEARPQEVSYMKGKVFDATNRKALRAEFELVDLETEEKVSKSFSDPYNGEFLICIPTDRNYMLNVSKDGYLFFSENFSLKGIHEVSEPFHKDVPMQPLLSGKTIVLNNVFFETASYELKKESFPELNKLTKFLQINKEIKVEISGHTDNVGDKAYNLDLSEKRAEAVVDYLIAQGVSSERMISKGYGYSKPVDTNNTHEGRAKNRRTELLVID